MDKRPKIHVLVALIIAAWICIGDSVSRMYAAPSYRRRPKQANTLEQLDTSLTVNYVKHLKNSKRNNGKKKVVALAKNNNLPKQQPIIRIIKPSSTIEKAQPMLEESVRDLDTMQEQEMVGELSDLSVESAVEQKVQKQPEEAVDVQAMVEAQSEPKITSESIRDVSVQENKETANAMSTLSVEKNEDNTGALIGALRDLAFSFKGQKEKVQVQGEDRFVRLDPVQLEELKNALMPKQELAKRDRKEINIQEADEDDDEDEMPIIRQRRPRVEQEEPLYQQQAPSGYAQQQVYQQPMVMYQQPQQNTMNQASAAAMQLQSSAMAMQAQASALMQQAQQQPQQMAPMVISAAPFAAQPPRPQPVLGTPHADMTKQEKIKMLMEHVQRIADSEHKIQRLLMILDLEFDIIEHLLGGTNGRPIEKKVQHRKDVVRESSPIVKTAYELIVDLSTSQGREDDVELYRFFVRKGKQQKDVAKQGAPGSGKKAFLTRMLKGLQRYYEMVENMQNVVDAA